MKNCKQADGYIGQFKQHVNKVITDKCIEFTNNSCSNFTLKPSINAATSFAIDIATAANYVNITTGMFIIDPPHYTEIAEYVRSKNDDKLIELIGNDEYYKTIRSFKNSVSERVRAAIDMAEIVET